MPAPQTYRSRLLARTSALGNTLCVGLDPVLSKIPNRDGKPADRIRRFFADLLEAMAKRRVFPAAVKPNSAYFEAQGIEALAALQQMISEYRSEGILVILDAKRGDIGTSSGAYAESAFGQLQSDAVTVAPYMGGDSIAPFREKSGSRGIYVLVRTSNPGAHDFQDLTVDLGQGEQLPLYKVVARKLAEWDNGDLGAVVGATAPRELEDIVKFWKALGKEIPMLIPGVSVPGVSGGQGGGATEVLRAIRGAGGDVNLHLINSSSGVNYAYERFSGMAPAEASLKAMEELMGEMAKAGSGR